MKFALKSKLTLDIYGQVKGFVVAIYLPLASGSLPKKVSNASIHIINSNVVDRGHKDFQTEDEQNRSFVKHPFAHAKAAAKAKKQTKQSRMLMLMLRICCDHFHFW